MWRLSARVQRVWAPLLRSLARQVPAWLRWSAAAVFVVLAWRLVADVEAVPATGWMAMYRMEDFKAASDAWLFFGQLRTGIPPFLAFLEITLHLVLGSTALIDVHLYRAGLVLAFTLPFLAFAATRLEFVCSLAISLVFLRSTLIVTMPNRQLYDVLLPVFLLLFTLCLRKARVHAAWGRSALGYAALAGFFLSMAELSRAFVLLILPFFLIAAYQFLRGAPKRCLAAFLLPLVLLSGGWPDFVGKEVRQLGQPDEAAFLGMGKWRSWGLNSQAHAEKSRALTAAVLRHVLREPIDSSLFVAHRISVLLEPRTSLWRKRPRDAVLDAYRPLVQATSGWLLLLAALPRVFHLELAETRLGVTLRPR